MCRNSIRMLIILAVAWLFVGEVEAATIYLPRVVQPGGFLHTGDHGCRITAAVATEHESLVACDGSIRVFAHGALTAGRELQHLNVKLGIAGLQITDGRVIAQHAGGVLVLARRVGGWRVVGGWATPFFPVVAVGVRAGLVAVASEKGLLFLLALDAEGGLTERWRWRSECIRQTIGPCRWEMIHGVVLGPTELAVLQWRGRVSVLSLEDGLLRFEPDRPVVSAGGAWLDANTLVLFGGDEMLTIGSEGQAVTTALPVEGVQAMYSLEHDVGRRTWLALHAKGLSLMRRDGQGGFDVLDHIPVEDAVGMTPHGDGALLLQGRWCEARSSVVRVAVVNGQSLSVEEAWAPWSGIRDLLFVDDRLVGLAGAGTLIVWDIVDGRPRFRSSLRLEALAEIALAEMGGEPFIVSAAGADGLAVLRVRPELAVVGTIAYAAPVFEGSAGVSSLAVVDDQVYAGIQRERVGGLWQVDLEAPESPRSVAYRGLTGTPWAVAADHEGVYVLGGPRGGRRYGLWHYDLDTSGAMSRQFRFVWWEPTRDVVTSMAILDGLVCIGGADDMIVACGRIEGESPTFDEAFRLDGGENSAWLTSGESGELWVIDARARLMQVRLNDAAQPMRRVYEGQYAHRPSRFAIHGSLVAGALTCGPVSTYRIHGAGRVP